MYAGDENHGLYAKWKIHIAKRKSPASTFEPAVRTGWESGALNQRSAGTSESSHSAGDSMYTQVDWPATLAGPRVVGVSCSSPLSPQPVRVAANNAATSTPDRCRFMWPLSW